MRKCISVLGLFIGLVAILLSLPRRDHGEIWPVLVAGSPGFQNYGMQADICGAYQILIKGKVKRDHIIVLMTDDVANNHKNFKRGSILNHPDGPDVYHGIPKDYTGENLSIHNFLAVLAGNKSLIRGGSGKVLATKANDRIFLFYSGHGRRGSIQVGNKLLRRDVLLKALQQNYKENKYKSMVIYLSTCFAGSMFLQVNEAYKMINVYAMTASNDNEYSRQVYKREKLGIYLATQFGTLWMKDSERYDRRKRSIRQQYVKVRESMDAGGKGSDVMEFGELHISKQMLSMYQGFA